MPIHLQGHLSLECGEQESKAVSMPSTQQLLVPQPKSSKHVCFSLFLHFQIAFLIQCGMALIQVRDVLSMNKQISHYGESFR